MLLLQGVFSFVVLLLAVSGFYCWGGAVARLIQPRPEADGGLLPNTFRIGAGIAAFSTVILYLGLVGLWSRPVFALLLVLVLAPGALQALRLGRRWWLREDRPGNGSISLVLFALGLFALPGLVLPPHARDALVYHLEVPRQFLLHQGFADLGGNVFAFFPLGIEMLYLPCLAFFPPFAVQVVHFGFLLLLVYGLAEFRQYVLRSDRLPVRDVLLLLSLASVPTLWRDATWAYIDAGWVYFGFLAAAAAWGLLRRESSSDLRYGILFLAFFLAIKYPGFYFVLILALALLAVRLAGQRVRQATPRAAAAALVCLALVAGPYYLRNLTLTGNPLFPFFTFVFGSGHAQWSPDHEQALKLGILGQYGEDIPPFLAPVMFLWTVVNPVLDDPARFDGVIGPFLLLWLIPLLDRRRGPPREVLLPVFIAAYLVAWGLVLKQARFLMPVLPVILMYVFCRAPAPGKGAQLRRRAAWAMIAVTLAFNLAVLAPAVFRLPLARVMAGSASGEELLDRQLPVYRCQRFINERLPLEARVWVLLTGNENFYLQRRYLADYIVEEFSFQEWLSRSDKSLQVLHEFRARHATHLLIRTDLVFEPAMYLDKPEKFPLVFDFFRNRTAFLYEANGYAVFRLKDAPPAD